MSSCRSEHEMVGGNVCETFLDSKLILLDHRAFRQLVEDRDRRVVMALVYAIPEPAMPDNLPLGNEASRARPVTVRDLLRHAASTAQGVVPEGGEAKVVQVRDIVIDFESRTVQVGHDSVKLTGTQFEILAILARNAGRAISRREIMQRIWGNVDAGLSRSLDVHLTALRAKLQRPSFLHTIRGFGYRFG